MRLFGPRVAIEQVKEEVSGMILIPEKVDTHFKIGVVTEVGDGVVAGKDAPDPILVSVGDIVMFQLVGVQDQMSLYKVGGNMTHILLQDDLLARTQKRIALDTIEILGDWTLIRVTMPVEVSGIILPEKAKLPATFQYNLEQKGSRVALECNRGDELAVERMRCTPMEIEGDAYVYCHQRDIYGVIG